MLPRLYAILDVGSLCGTGTDPAAADDALCAYAAELAAGGVRLMQYRAKGLDAPAMLRQARALRRSLPAEVTLVMNDRADLCLAAGLDGVHVGQQDLSPKEVRGIVGPGRMVGVSTHNPEQFAAALASSADYLAIGPVFATGSKANPDPVVGLAGVRAVRELLDRAGGKQSLVAIGGITQANARAVIEAGADSVAVIGDLRVNPRHSAEEFLRIL